MCKRLLTGLLCLVICTTSGCWDAVQLEETALMLIGSYDLRQVSGKHGEIIEVGSMVAVLDKNAPQKYYIDVIPGITATGTRTGRLLRIDKQEFRARTLQGMLYGEALARRGLHLINDYPERTGRFGINLPIGVVEGKARDALHIDVERSPNPAFFLRDLLRTANKQNFIVNMNLQQFTHHAHSPGLNPVLPLLRVYRDPDAKQPSRKVKISGTAIFKEDRMIAKVDTKESEVLTLLRGWRAAGNFTQAVQTANGMDNVTVSCSNKRKVKVRRVGDEYYYTVTVLLDGTLAEHSLREQMIDGKYVRQIESSFEKSLKKRCDTFIDMMQHEFKVDCIDITGYALAKWRGELEQQDFSELVQHYHINVAVKLNITEAGELY